jgi:hypothetical protein
MKGNRRKRCMEKKWRKRRKRRNKWRKSTKWKMWNKME